MELVSNNINNVTVKQSILNSGSTRAGFLAGLEGQRYTDQEILKPILAEVDIMLRSSRRKRRTLSSL
jgi:hypothetical protein